MYLYRDQFTPRRHFNYCTKAARDYSIKLITERKAPDLSAELTFIDEHKREDGHPEEVVEEHGDCCYQNEFSELRIRSHK